MMEALEAQFSVTCVTVFSSSVTACTFKNPIINKAFILYSDAVTLSDADLKHSRKHYRAHREHGELWNLGKLRKVRHCVTCVTACIGRLL